ncbi:MAG: ClpX C4-type zinc finger protein [Candidatus Gastranaerophilales bacterium]|nr:ClpX C4-type zinc finger protein [Candidatus Gastranaerophilales bacterium]
MSDEEKVVSLGAAREKHKAEEEITESKDSSEIKEEMVYCSFCKRPNHQVIKMIKGPGVNICSECTLICVQYLILQGDEAISNEARKVLDLFWSEAKK